MWKVSSVNKIISSSIVFQVNKTDTSSTSQWAWRTVSPDDVLITSLEPTIDPAKFWRTCPIVIADVFHPLYPLNLSLTPVRNDDMTTMNNSLVIAEFLRTILFVFERLWILFNFRNSILPSCLRRNINFDWKMWATLSARGQVLGKYFYSL